MASPSADQLPRQMPRYHFTYEKRETVHELSVRYRLLRHHGDHTSIYDGQYIRVDGSNVPPATDSSAQISLKSIQDASTINENELAESTIMTDVVSPVEAASKPLLPLPAASRQLTIRQSAEIVSVGRPPSSDVARESLTQQRQILESRISLLFRRRQAAAHDPSLSVNAIRHLRISPASSRTPTPATQLRHCGAVSLLRRPLNVVLLIAIFTCAICVGLRICCRSASVPAPSAPPCNLAVWQCMKDDWNAKFRCCERNQVAEQNASWLYGSLPMDVWLVGRKLQTIINYLLMKNNY